MSEIKKKISPEYFELIASGKKKFEFRLADFELNEGDTLVLEEWSEGENGIRHTTGRTLEKVVTHMLRAPLEKFGDVKAFQEKGFYVIQFD